MKCPRCQADITATPDQGSFIVCPGCGARLRSRPLTAVAPAPAPAANPNLTLPPGTPLVAIPSSLPAGAHDLAGDGATVEAVLAELKALRSVQEEIVELLRSRPAPRPDMPAQRPAVSAVEGGPPLRARRRKTVLLLDDDPDTRAAARAALDAAEVPVRDVDDGNAALALIAREKPDVIVMELGVAGAMPGKDVVNLVKATMEWVDIPIVLYTRMAIDTQHDVRQTHGADDYVRKGDGAPNQLVSRVIAHFRRT